LVQNSKFSDFHDSNQSFPDSRLKLYVNFVWSPFVLDSMVQVFKKLKAMIYAIGCE